MTPAEKLILKTFLAAPDGAPVSFAAKKCGVTRKRVWQIAGTMRND